MAGPDNAISVFRSGGAGKCTVCNHPGVVIMNYFLEHGAVELDGQLLSDGKALGEYLFAKYPDAPRVQSYHLSRHKSAGHVGGGKGIAVVVRGSKLFRRKIDGSEVELPSYGVVDALGIVVNMGVDAVLRGRKEVGVRDLVEALRLLAEMSKGKDDADEYKRAISEYLQGAGQAQQAIASREESVDDILDEIQVMPPQEVAGVKLEQFVEIESGDD